jgi:hypothetical protein
MRRTAFCIVILMIVAPAAMGQAITGFSGGTQYDTYYGGVVAGDVVGYRFEVTAPLEVAMLGVWNADSSEVTTFPQEVGTPGVGNSNSSEALSSPHQVGIWDAGQNLIASVTVDPGTGTIIGDWTYDAITPVTLLPGQVYTAGAMYTTTDSDSYISGASGVTTDPNVVWLNSVYPAAIDLGFVFPTEDSAPSSGGRFGPNFTFTVVPVELQSFSVE